METDDQSQADHAQHYGALCRRMTRRAVAIARTVAPGLSPLDVADAFAIAAVSLVLTVGDQETAIRLLRRLADALAAGRPMSN